MTNKPEYRAQEKILTYLELQYMKDTAWSAQGKVEIIQSTELENVVLHV